MLVGVIIVGFFLRFYKLSAYPVNLSHDEVSQFYDAISILQTGKDIHGNHLPFIFPSIGDYKPPFYTYATLIPLLVFGWNEITIRIVGAFFGVLIIPAVYFFVSRLFSSKKIALLAAFFTAIAPFEIHFSRKSFEGGAGVVALLIGFGLLISYLKKKNNKLFILGSTILALGTYTYFSHAILIPVLYLSFLLIFRGRLKPIPTAGLIAFLFIVLPLITFITLDKNSVNRSKAVFITQDSVLADLISKNISKTEEFSSIKKNLIIAKYSALRYLNQFDPTYLFSNGLDLTNQDPIDVGPFYFFQLPLVLLGLIYIYKKKDFKECKFFILAWILIGLIPSGITFEKHSPHRVIMVLTMLNIISACGAFSLFRFIQNRLKSPIIKIGLIGALSILLVWNLSYFIYLYTIDYPFDKSEFTQYPYKQVSLLAWANYDKYDQIVFDPKFGEYAPWIGGAVQYYLAFYGKYPPAKMQQEFRQGDQTKKETIFGKFHIRDVYWLEDKKLKKTLIIASPWVVSKESSGTAKEVGEIKAYDGTVTFYALETN